MLQLTLFGLAIPWLSSHVGFVLNIVAMELICPPDIPFDTVRHPHYSILSYGGRGVGPLETVVSGDVTSTDPSNNLNP
jgi:hypothetical protein